MMFQLGIVNLIQIVSKRRNCAIFDLTQLEKSSQNEYEKKLDSIASVKRVLIITF
ncbi:unnamed protein product [Paramecium octaurelia]|uniref:Uncharacterized protein n=1 Tax=Paramecium octaurelia TaxID=43137 RepID=A0A8S1TB01_PAROT|nr:unnamed protein product [Paramecium octaurelia]